MSLTCDCAYQPSACVWTQPTSFRPHSQMFVYWHVSGRWWRKMLWPRWSSELDIHMMVCIIVQSPTCALPCLLQLKWRTRETSRLQQKIRFTSSAGSGVNVVASLVFLGLRMWFSHTHTHQCTMSVIHNVMEWVQYIHHVRTPVHVLYAYTLGRNRSSTHTYKQTNHLFVVIKRKGKNINRVKRR